MLEKGKSKQHGVRINKGEIKKEEIYGKEVLKREEEGNPQKGSGSPQKLGNRPQKWDGSYRQVKGSTGKEQGCSQEVEVKKSTQDTEESDGKMEERVKRLQKATGNHPRIRQVDGSIESREDSSQRTEGNIQ